MTHRFLYLSNLVPEKGILDLIESLELLGERGKGMELRCAGEAEDAVVEEVKRRAERVSKHGIALSWDGVLHGREKVQALAWAQVLVLPSRYPEGQPISVLEAMSAGLAVISTDRGRPLPAPPNASRPSLCPDPSGTPYTARDGKEALIVAPGEPGELAEAIATLIERPELRAELGRAARRRYLEVYRPECFRRNAQGLLLAQ